jgi:hypothetical protein
MSEVSNRPAKRTPTEAELQQLGQILARFCQDSSLAYWGSEGRMTIDNSIEISTVELQLLDDLFEQW